MNMNKSKCDILIRAGHLLTMDSERRIYNSGSVAITKSHIVGIGTDEDILHRFDARETINARNGIVHPGFIAVSYTHLTLPTTPYV